MTRKPVNIVAIRGERDRQTKCDTRETDGQMCTNRVTDGQTFQNEIKMFTQIR